MNEGLFTAYQGLPEWEKLLNRLSNGDCTALYEIPEGERPFLAAALAHSTRTLPWESVSSTCSRCQVLSRLMAARLN